MKRRIVLTFVLSGISFGAWAQTPSPTDESDGVPDPLGQVLQAVNVPLATVAQGVAGWARDEPVVITCKAGGRAARALATMQQLGFEHVASMEGGMLGWHAAGLPVAPR